MSKYQSLAEGLEDLSHGAPYVDLGFSEVAAKVGGLPRSAYEHRSWWANDSKVQGRAWRAAGWHVDRVDLNGQTVRFARGKVGGSRARRLGLE